MVSGAAGIDMVVLVIAADEGVMPQTREHLQICELLGIKKGLVALTKIDLVDKDWLDLVEDDVRNFLQGTFMENAPIIPVSALSGEGLEGLLDALIDAGIRYGCYRNTDIGKCERGGRSGDFTPGHIGKNPRNPDSRSDRIDS
jgi:selenocysteine-specific elongation factor